jgi:integral membrane sensor domain MASE1
MMAGFVIMTLLMIACTDGWPGFVAACALGYFLALHFQ